MANLLLLKMQVHYIHSEQQQPSAIVQHMHSTLLQLSCLVLNGNQNFSPHLVDITLEFI
jgi:hypothetical protein